MNNDKKPAQPDTKPKAPAAEEKDPAAPKKPGYIFKIVPADPKNAFDFEDVADK